MTSSMSLAVIAIAVVGAMLCVSVILGNGTVIAAIVFDQRLRGVQHSFIASLAAADLLLGVLVLPFSLVKELLNNRWIFGQVWCTLWLAIDVLLCTSSILNLCLISIDRYFSIRFPMRYPQFRTMPRVFMAIMMVWLLSALISLPPLIGLTKPQFRHDEQSVNDSTVNGTFNGTYTEETCKLVDNLFYIFYSSFGTFYIPMTVLIVIYINIFREARRRMTARKMNPQKLDFLIAQTLRPDAPPQTETPKRRPLSFRKSPAKRAMAATTTITTTTTVMETGESSQLQHLVPNTEAEEPTPNASTSTHQQKRSSVVEMFQRRRQQRKQRERRTTLVLSLILGAFLFCWLPFFIVYVIDALCTGGCVPAGWFSAFFWMGYCNSALNPIIYTIFNAEYRQAMRRVWWCV